jgi:hypothetical protein
LPLAAEVGVAEAQLVVAPEPGQQVQEQVEEVGAEPERQLMEEERRAKQAQAEQTQAVEPRLRLLLHFLLLRLNYRRQALPRRY